MRERNMREDGKRETKAGTAANGETAPAAPAAPSPAEPGDVETPPAGEGGEDEQKTVLDEMDRLRTEMDDLKELYLRKLAEFDNFRKRVEREREEIRETVSADLVRELVPVLDNFERALQHASESGFDAFREGVELIAKQLWEALSRRGLKRLDPINEKFDPVYHEAVQRVEDSGHEPDQVVSVLAKGYTFGKRLVRPAMVAVAVGSKDGGETGEAPEAGAGESEDRP
ncbi:MAG: nucleotide exchange factor GrpE [Acidobacteria bacterium]|nr:nucleotide exchange factor GrpE [Acidobacteriota bacterium]